MHSTIQHELSFYKIATNVDNKYSNDFPNGINEQNIFVNSRDKQPEPVPEVRTGCKCTAPP